MDIRINGTPSAVNDDDIDELMERLERRLQGNGVGLTDEARDELRRDIGGMLGDVNLTPAARATLVAEVIAAMPGEVPLPDATHNRIVAEVIAALPAPGPVELTEASRHALRDEIIAALPAHHQPRWVAWVLGAILLLVGAAAFGVFNGGFGNNNGSAPAPAPILPIGGGTVQPGAPGTATTPTGPIATKCPDGRDCYAWTDPSAPGGIRIIPIPPATPTTPPAPTPPTAPAMTKQQCIDACVARNVTDTTLKLSGPESLAQCINSVCQYIP